jgi:hypothetical protein
MALYSLSGVLEKEIPMTLDYYKIMPKWTTDNNPPGSSYNYAYYFIHPWKLVKDWYRQTKWFIQRGYRGYADCDVWSIDWYLTDWLPAALHQLEDNKIGYPCGMTAKGWRICLAKMTDGFIAAREIQEMKYKYKSSQERAAWRRFNRGMKLFRKHFFDLWD